MPVGRKKQLLMLKQNWLQTPRQELMRKLLLEPLLQMPFAKADAQAASKS
jgi:hypothetical protein